MSLRTSLIKCLFFFALTTGLIADATLPADLQAYLRNVCAHINMLSASLSPQRLQRNLAEIIYGRYDKIFPLIRQEFSGVIDAYILEELKRGRGDVLVFHEIERTFDLYFTMEMTPAGLAKLLQANQQEMVRFRKLGADKSNSLYLEDLDLRSNQTQLANLYSRFQKLHLPVRLMGMADIMRLFGDRSLQSLVQRYPRQQQRLLLWQAFQQSLETYISREATYVTFGRTPGIYLPNYINIPGLRPLITMQASFAVSDAYWDDDVVLDFFLKNVRPKINRVLSGFGEAVVRSTYGKAKDDEKFFLEDTLYPKKREQVVQRAHAENLDALDLFLFYQLHKLARVVQGHLLAGLKAKELGRPIEFLEPENLLSHINVAFAETTKEIDPIAIRVFDDIAVIESLLQKLNSKLLPTPGGI